MKLMRMIQVESSVDFLPPVILIPEYSFENFILWLNTKFGYDISILAGFIEVGE